MPMAGAQMGMKSIFELIIELGDRQCRRQSFSFIIVHHIFYGELQVHAAYMPDEAPLFIMWGGDEKQAKETACHEFSVKDGILVAGAEQ